MGFTFIFICCLPSFWIFFTLATNLRNLLEIKIFPMCKIATKFFYTQCLNASMPQCLNASMPQCFNASMPQCLNASMPQCLNASMPQCFNASMLQCFNASMLQFFNSSIPFFESTKVIFNRVSTQVSEVLVVEILFEFDSMRFLLPFIDFVLLRDILPCIAYEEDHT